MNHDLLTLHDIAEEGRYLGRELGSAGAHHQLFDTEKLVHLLLDMRGQGEEAGAVGIDLDKHVVDEVLGDTPLAGVRSRFEADGAAPTYKAPPCEGVNVQSAVVGPLSEVAVVLVGAIAMEVAKGIQELHRRGSERGFAHVTLVGELLLVHRTDLRNHVFEFEPAGGSWGT